ncbi:MAG: hypothetical protein ABDH21_02440 [bacterium]
MKEYNILLFGYNGLIGNNLFQFIQKNNLLPNAQLNKIFCLSRKQIKNNIPNTHFISYSLNNLQSILTELLNSQKSTWIVLIFVGENILGLTTQKKWEKIYQSRVTVNQKIVSSLIESKADIYKIVSASAVGIYYQNPLEKVDESSPIQPNLISNLILEWENTLLNSPLSEKSIILRIGAVIDKKSNIHKMLYPLALFSIGINITPTSPFPWIHNQEIPLIIQHLLQNNQQGIFNTVNTNYLTYQEFLQKYITKYSLIKKAFLINIPKTLVRNLMKMAMPKYYELTYSLFCLPQIVPYKLIQTNYPFRYFEL